MPRTRFILCFASILTITGSIALADDPVQITITAADLAAAAQSSAASAPSSFKASSARAANPFRGHGMPKLEEPAAPPLYYPLDLYNFGGPTLHNFDVHDVFVNPVSMPGGTYGQAISGPSIDDADTFLSHLFASRMIHIEDQYTGTPGEGGNVGRAGVIRYNNSATTYYDLDLRAFAHASGRTFGTGLQHVVNLFYNQGIDLCPFDGDCYSPDNLSTWAFCAYHNYFDFADIGRVFFTMQPYQNVSDPRYPITEAGCQVPPGGMHSQAVESMASTLSHETFESISDPTVDAWVQGFIGFEMADLCVRLWYDVPLFGPTYRLQAEYSNQYHACVWTP